MQQMMGDILQHLPTAPRDKWPILERHVNYYHNELIPLAKMFSEYYSNQLPELNEQGFPIDTNIEVSEAEAKRRHVHWVTSDPPVGAP